MSQKLQIVPVTAILVALLGSALAATYDPSTDVRESSNKDFSDDGQLVLKKVAVRVRFGQAEYGQVRDLTRTTLNASLMYQVICRHESLRSAAETRSRSLELVAAVQDQLAGARLLLPDQTVSEPILLRSVLPVSDQFGPVEDCYGVGIEVTGFSQFAGINAVPTNGVAA